MQKSFKFSQGGLEVEIGKFARQADGAAWVKSNNNIILSTVVSSKKETEFMGFFPLTVEYRERLSAAGKIPGGYLKREGKLSDDEVLISRLIDRAIRPLFPKFYFNEVQLLSTVYSSDGTFPSNVLAILSASLSLVISDIPFSGPVGAVQANRVDGTWHFNTSHDMMAKADSSIIIAGLEQGVCMVEGYCNNLSETEFIDVMFQAHMLIKEQIKWQQEVATSLGVTKRKLESKVNWELWEEKVLNFLPADFASKLFGDNKLERTEILNSTEALLLETFKAHIEAEEVSASILKFLFHSLLKEIIPATMVEKQLRFDSRSFDQVRPLEGEVGFLPCAHGSGMFRRGETQVLTTITLGTAQDAQKVDTLLAGTQERSFMLHYNFPPFSTGEVRPMRGVGRREIGHGYLAEKSFFHVLPEQKAFPYTIRSLADVLESNGSSSMATVCATTLALMDAGVPIKDFVGGIAMGLIQDKAGNFQVLTDILGTEDEFGLMDFKVTGTTEGIMAIQMDIKVNSGLTKELMTRALNQARSARLHIIEYMKTVLGKPREQISGLAPQVVSFTIDQDKIGAVIGPAGKNIKEITAQTNTEVDIEDNGVVRVYAKNKNDAERAKEWVRLLGGDVEVGGIFEGIIRRIAEFGLFVELVPGKEGLVHISTIAREKQSELGKKSCNVGDKLTVRIVSYEKETNRIRLVAPELEKKKDAPK